VPPNLPFETVARFLFQGFRVYAAGTAPLLVSFRFAARECSSSAASAGFPLSPAHWTSRIANYFSPSSPLF